MLGDVFIKNYYVTFNYEQNTIGMAQNANGPVSYNAGLRWWAIMLLCILGLAVLAAVFGGILYCRGRQIMEDHALSSKLSTSNQTLDS